VSQTDHQPPAAPSRDKIWSLFDRIAARYDLLNHLLSAGRDRVWRRRMNRLLPDRHDLSVLDVATGTGDQLLALYDSGRVSKGAGIDLAEKMLAVGMAKIESRGLHDHLTLTIGDGQAIPFDNDAFDVVSISFGIRNMTDVPLALTEMRRVLKPGGRALILEFSLPTNAVIRTLYLFYFRHLLPRIGHVVSGDSKAYRYLNQTVETFPCGDAFCELMQQAGFHNIEAHVHTLGIVTIYRGDK
jgi:demethylmenaquinone methyltransferase / 2-methoxy-6-polyprenyl-1,4-benzoquinol methylase